MNGRERSGWSHLEDEPAEADTSARGSSVEVSVRAQAQPRPRKCAWGATTLARELHQGSQNSREGHFEDASVSARAAVERDPVQCTVQSLDQAARWLNANRERCEYAHFTTRSKMVHGGRDVRLEIRRAVEMMVTRLQDALRATASTGPSVLEAEVRGIDHVTAARWYPK